MPSRLVSFFSDYRDVLPDGSTPALMVECRNDIITPMAVTHYVEAHLPDVTLAVLDAAGHCPHMSHPDATTAAIDAYLDAPPAQSPDYA
mgnify:CR=1 FL=1